MKRIELSDLGIQWGPPAPKAGIMPLDQSDNLLATEKEEPSPHIKQSWNRTSEG